MKDHVFGVLQRIGRSFMLPIALLPAAGLLLGLGSSFTNKTMLEAYGLAKIMGQGTLIYSILSVMSQAGSAVFNNLPLIFAIGVAIGMAKKEKEVAALAAAVAFIIMHSSLSTMIWISGGGKNAAESAEILYNNGYLAANSWGDVLGITTLNMGVFGGIIVGLGVAALHNRFYRVEFPQVLSFFGGTRFVPIISAVVYVIAGILMYYIWPFVGSAISWAGNIVQISGFIGTFIYGFMERLLIPFGLHHVFYIPFWQTDVGGTMIIQGETVSGAQNIFFAQLADPDTVQFAVSATRFMSGKFPLMIFGLPGAALAMYKCARNEKKQEVGALLLSAALTSMITGITEPLEFTFLFVAPILYGVHCVFAGAAYMLMHMLKVGVGMTFSGGLIDLFLFGILPGASKTNWLWIIPVGIIYFIIYYYLFSFLIQKNNLKTPGRDDSREDTKLYTREDFDAKKQHNDDMSQSIVQGLGGLKNISDVDCCATRLRCTVYDGAIVNEEILKSTGASGVIHKGKGVQIIYGPRVTVIKSALDDYMAGNEKSDTKKDKQITKNNNIPKIEKNKRIIEEEIFSPLAGKIISLKNVNDGVFSEKMLGDGIAIEPLDGRVTAPFDGFVEMVYDTKHALGLKSNKGAELLIHFGIDTVKLNGEPFDVAVSSGDEIKKGDLLMTANIEKIKEAGCPVTTPVIVTNSDEYKRVIHYIPNGKVKNGDLILKVK